MRLLNSHTWKMEEFISDNSTPPYAILSHTWGEPKDECTLKEWETLKASQLRKKRGFQKIEHCCRLAAQDGLEWVWIDTYEELLRFSPSPWLLYKLQYLVTDSND